MRVRCVPTVLGTALRTLRTLLCMMIRGLGHCTVECAAVLASALAVGAAFDFACGLGGVFLHD